MIQTLKGIKVIDMTIAGAGPAAGRLLAEYGADVIMVEPTTGVNTRVYHCLDAFHGDKRSIALNLKDPDGLQAMLDLLKTADVFLPNYRLRALEKLGLTWEKLHELNPKLVYAVLTGYGMTGPRRDDPGFDVIGYWAMSGLASLVQDADGLPIVMPGAIGDTSAGRSLALGVINALFHRERTGEAIKVTTSLITEGLYVNHDAITEGQYGTQYPRSRKAPRHSLLNTYQCKDGWVALITLNFEPDFWNIMRAIGREDLVGDPRWTKFSDTDNEGAPEIVEIFDKAFIKFTCKEAQERLAAYNIACQPLLSVYDVVNDPQILANQYLIPHKNYDGKEIVVPSSPVRYGDDEPISYGNTPKIGQHSIEILRSIGYSDEKINAMLKKHATAELELTFTDFMSMDDLRKAVEESRSEV